MDPLELQPSHEQKIEHKALLRRRLITGFRTPRSYRRYPNAKTGRALQTCIISHIF
jgi:hypothetical protein